MADLTDGLAWAALMWGVVIRRGGERGQRVSFRLNSVSRHAGQFRQMLAKHIGGSLRFGDAQAEACFREASSGAVEFAVDAFFNPIGNCSFHLLDIGIALMQTIEALLPLFKFGVTEDRVLDDLVALVLAAKACCGSLALSGADKSPQFGMK